MARTALLHALHHTHTHTHTHHQPHNNNNNNKNGGGGGGGGGEFAGRPEPFSSTETDITRKMVKIINIITHTLIFKTHALQTPQLTCTARIFHTHERLQF